MSIERGSPAAIQIPQSIIRLRLIHELLFSIYFPFLILSAHEGEAGGRWAIKLIHWAVLHDYLHANVGIEDNRIFLADFLLLWLSAALIFSILRSFARSSITCLVLQSFAGLVAVAGFPLASMYVRGRRVLSPEVALLLGGVCLVLSLWANRKWRVTRLWNIFLLLLYFAVWATPLAGGTSLQAASWILLWPGAWRWALGIWQHGWIIYPFLGFCSTLVWAAYFRQSEKNNQCTTAAIAG
jgi:hypothetical protein